MIIIFVRLTPKVSLVGIVLRAESWFVDGLFKFSAHLKFYGISAGKSSYRSQNDTDSTNFRYTANKQNRSYHVRNVF